MLYAKCFFALVYFTTKLFGWFTSFLMLFYDWLIDIVFVLIHFFDLFKIWAFFLILSGLSDAMASSQQSSLLRIMSGKAVWMKSIIPSSTSVPSTPSCFLACSLLECRPPNKFKWLLFTLSVPLQHRFTFRPIYAADTPSRLPPNVLLRGVKQRILKWAKKIVHAVLVLAVWLVLLPNYCGRLPGNIVLRLLIWCIAI